MMPCYAKYLDQWMLQPTQQRKKTAFCDFKITSVEVWLISGCCNLPNREKRLHSVILKSPVSKCDWSRVLN